MTPTGSSGPEPVTALVALAPASYRRTPWKNGGGVTVDIADAYRPGATPGGWSGLVWRFGRTAITTPAPFSDLSGCDRVQVVVQGRGLVLRVSDGRAIDLREPWRPARFSGDWAITSELGAGPVEVLNLIGDREAVALDLRVLRAGEAVEAARGDHVLYAPADEVRARIGEAPVTLAPDHAVRFAARETVRVEAGTAVLASATPP